MAQMTTSEGRGSTEVLEIIVMKESWKWRIKTGCELVTMGFIILVGVCVFGCGGGVRVLESYLCPFESFWRVHEAKKRARSKSMQYVNKSFYLYLLFFS